MKDQLTIVFVVPFSEARLLPVSNPSELDAVLSQECPHSRQLTLLLALAII